MQNPMSVCPHCGTQISAQARFCKACGKPVAAATCQRCGRPLRPGIKFCESCGAPVVCSRCGNPLRPDSKFCGSCGQPVSVRTTSPAAPPPPPPVYSPPARVAPPPIAYAPPAPPATKPEAEQEPVVGVIPGLERSKGRLKAEMFNLVVTPGRLVFALITQKMMNDAIQEARAEAKRQGKGMLAQVAAQMAWLDVIGNRYQGMSVEAILAEQPESFFIPNDEIKAVEIASTEPDEEVTLQINIRFARPGQSGSSGYCLIIKTRSEEYQFNLKGGQWAQETRQLLQQVLGNVVR